MKVQLFNDHAYDFEPIVVDRRDVAKTISRWFSDASDDIEQAIDDLQRSLDIAAPETLGTESSQLSTSRLCAFLGVTLRPAEVAQPSYSAMTIENTQLTQDEINRASKLCRSEGVPMMYTENVARILREAGRQRPTG